MSVCLSVSLSTCQEHHTPTPDGHRGSLVSSLSGSSSHSPLLSSHSSRASRSHSLIDSAVQYCLRVVDQCERSEYVILCCYSRAFNLGVLKHLQLVETATCAFNVAELLIVHSWCVYTSCWFGYVMWLWNKPCYSVTWLNQYIMWFWSCSNHVMSFTCISHVSCRTNEDSWWWLNQSSELINILFLCQFVCVAD